MMEWLDKLEEVERRRKMLEQMGPLSPEALRKLEYRWRLDWNFHSLTMEGNRFTREETQSIMSGLVNVANRTVKDVQEMIGHDEVLREVMGIASGEIQLSEKRILAIHKAIIHEEKPEDRAKAGSYKTTDNYAYNFHQERVDYLPWPQVKEALHKLIDRTKAGLEAARAGKKDALHPLIIAFDFHTDFLYIHPFHDGNGRMSRILLNIVLLSAGYPPIVVKKEEREVYARLLTDVQFYGATRDAYYAFMLDLVLRSQEMMEKAHRGESLEEPDDLQKRQALLKQQMELMRKENAVELEYSDEIVRQMLGSWVKDLTMELEQLRVKLSELYLQTEFRLLINGERASIESLSDLKPESNRGVTQVELYLRFEKAIHVTGDLFNQGVTVFIGFDRFSWAVRDGSNHTDRISRKYNVGLSAEEIKLIVAKNHERILNSLEQQIRRK